jgi:hypothetical protein
MGWGFFRAAGNFWVGRQSPRVLTTIYEAADRDVWVQPLPLTTDEKRRLLARLEHDVQDAHKRYAYDHLTDNCSTRVRDALDEATGGKLRAMQVPSDGRTYRDLARRGFFGMRVALLITDLAMGRAADRVPTYYERMFLPEYLRGRAAAVGRRAGGGLPAQGAATAERRPERPRPAGADRRRAGGAGRAGALAPTLAADRAVGRADPAARARPDLLGAGDHQPLPYVRWNETCLVLLPLDLLLVIGPARWRVGYARARVAMIAAVALLLAVGVLRQPLWSILAWPLIPAAMVALPPRARATSGPSGAAVG